MITSSRFFLALWLVSASCVGSPEPCVADTTVALHGDSEIRAATVRLSDLFSGVPQIIDRDIAQAPLPGKTAVYDARVLEKLAEKYRLDWHAMNAADHVTLTTAATRITTDDLRAAIIHKIEESGVHGDIEASFDNRAVEIDLPGDQRPDFAFNSFDFDPVSKRFRCEIVAGRGAAAVSLPVAGRANVKRHVPVLAHRLESGTVIALTDIDWATVSDDRVAANVVTSADQLIGHELRHNVNDGDVLHTNDIMPARLVTRGSLVTLKIETPYMQLTAQGRALQDGAEGDVVRVNNTQSNRMVEGTVTGPGEVSIHTGQKLASAQ
jgi:flagella basal body P-ring formation protein FlgA